MAQYIGVLCDWCAHLGLEDVPAAVQRVLEVDGPPRRVDLCYRCDLALAPFLALYEVGQDLPEEDGARAGRTGGRRRRSAGQKQPTQLEQPEQPQQPKRQEQPEQPDQSAVRRRGGRVRDGSRVSLVCPLEHPHSGGGPSRVSYSGRSGHADMVHGLHFTKIAWQDPDGILAFPCTAHDACRANRVSFTSRTGLTNHLHRYREPAPGAGTDGAVVALLPARAAAPSLLAASGE